MKDNVIEAYDVFVKSLNKRKPDMAPMTIEEFAWELDRAKKKIKKEGRKASSNKKLATAIATSEIKTVAKPKVARQPKGLVSKIEKDLKNISGTYKDPRKFVEKYVRKNMDVIGKRFEEYGATGDDKFDEGELRRFVNRVMSKINTPEGQLQHRTQKSWKKAVYDELRSSAFSSADERMEFKGMNVLRLEVDEGWDVRKAVHHHTGKWAEAGDVHTVDKSKGGKTITYEICGVTVKVTYSYGADGKPFVEMYA